MWELEVGPRPSPRIRGCRRRSARTASTTRTPWPPSSTRCAGARSPRRTPNSYQAPFRSGANVEAYQLEPLRRALQSARTNLLLADDVGLGKTIEAGLVIQELLLRHRARSVIIVCPPSLSLKWQDEMREKFGLRLRDRQQRADGAGAPQPRAERQPVPALPPGDRVAWRGCRRCAPSGCCATCTPTSRDTGTGPPVRLRRARRGRGAPRRARRSPSAATGFRGYAVDSHRTIATRALAEKCEHRLFLSATPHNGYSESFTALLEMIDGRRFKRGATLDERALRDVAVRRLKADLPDEGLPAARAQDAPVHPGRGRGGEVRAARPDPRPRARGRNGRGQVRRHRGDAAEEAVPVQPVVVRADPASCTSERRRRAAASSLDDEERVLPGGPRQRPVRRGGGRQPSTPSSPRCGSSKALRPAGRRHRPGDRRR